MKILQLGKAGLGRTQIGHEEPNFFEMKRVTTAEKNPIFDIFLVSHQNFSLKVIGFGFFFACIPAPSVQLGWIWTLHLLGGGGSS